MAALVIKSFAGISPKTPSRYLQDSQAQVAINCPVFSGSIQPLADVGASLLTLSKQTVPQTIYRYGQDIDSESQYWFNWGTDVDVCRSQIAGDESEWTFYTGDGAPKATYNTIALSASNYPAVSRPLGLPAPTTVVSTSLGPYDPETNPAEVYISAENVTATSSTYGVDYSLDDGATYTNVAVAAAAPPATTVTAAAIASALDAVATLTATVVAGEVLVKTTATGETAKLRIRIRTGSEVNKDSTFTYAGYDSTLKYGRANTIATLFVLDQEINSYDVGNKVDISIRTNETYESGDAASFIVNKEGLALADIVGALNYGYISLPASEVANVRTGHYMDISMTIGGTPDVIMRLIGSTNTYTAATLAAAMQAQVEQVAGQDAIYIGAVGNTVVISAMRGAVFTFSYSRYTTNPDPGGVSPAYNASSTGFIPSSGGSKIFTATAYGSVLVCEPLAKGTGNNDAISYARYLTAGGAVIESSKQTIVNSDSAAPARVILTQTNIDALEDSYLSTVTNDGEERKFVYNPSTASNIYGLVGPSANVVLYGAVSPIAVVTSVATGTTATLHLREGTFSTQATYAEVSGTGSIAAPSLTESRVYVYTWVNKESGFEFESAPSPASEIVDVHDGQTVTLSGFGTPTSGYTVTHKRIYRTVSGVYLFVEELELAIKNYTDSKDPDELSEELPSATWTPPPANLKGLINLPNGIMAGFVGRDVYLCDPYHPHAWPEQYVQTVDYPVVGLGRMDTTLAVLTTGTPYFLQGTSPDTMVLVKSDLEQSCSSKRSIVSANGVVMYASPDGLVLLTPSGSKIVTENYFTRAQWQAYFVPTSIHAYMQDLKYIGFYDNGTTSGGFIYDLTSGQLILHDIYATCGYTDLQRDQLYVGFSDRALKKWLGGSAKSYTWRSKKFTLPQVGGFSCAALEAESYPMTLKFYMDGTLFHTQTVASRDAFRLPVKEGRDFEMQIEGAYEVFSVAVAQSVEELSGV
jgi:hypothetical protein